MKKDYLSIIEKYTNHMTHDQLFNLFNLHTDLFITPHNVKIKIPNSYFNKPLKILTFYKIKHYTPKDQYINVVNLIHLICSNHYTEDQIYDIILDLI